MPPGAWSAGGSVPSFRRRSASSCSTTSGCATTSAGRCSTVERAPTRVRQIFNRPVPIMVHVDGSIFAARAASRRSRQPGARLVARGGGIRVPAVRRARAGRHVEADQFLISTGVDGHSHRCLQERFAGSYSMASCSLSNPPPWQRWSVSLNSRTSIKLVSTHGTCLFDDGLDLSPQSCTSSTESKQDWDLTYRSDGRIEIRNAETEDCLYFNTTSVAIQAVACLANVPTNSRWWFSPVSNTSATYNQWRAEGRCAQFTFGELVRNACGDASTRSRCSNREHPERHPRRPTLGVRRPGPVVSTVPSGPATR
jgi:hypothetical protein